MEDDPCPICLDNFDNSYAIIKCGHKFHIECFNNYVNNNKQKNLEITCPMCRDTIHEPIYNFNYLKSINNCCYCFLCCFLCF
jgi:hypothetical protein